MRQHDAKQFQTSGGASSARTLLIVNADDWGAGRMATDSILKCMVAGAVTSTSGMVHMADSLRAADLANQHALPVGLHLNLTAPYAGSAVPRGVRERQAQLVGIFGASRWAMWAYNPQLARKVRVCVRDQLEEFRTIYGREPSHIDGHHHVHTSPTVLLSGAFPADQKLRRTFTFPSGEKPWANRLFRSAVNRAIARRFVGTTYFLHLDSFVRAVRDGALRLDGNASIEVLNHPEFPAERDFLMSDSWLELISRFRLGNYDDLPMMPPAN